MSGRGLSVLQVVTDRDRRGAQVFATDLAPGLASCGFAVETVALADGPRGNALGVDVLGSGPRSARTLRELRRRARHHDVVIAHGSNTLVASSVALLGSTPFVYRQISDPLFWAASQIRRARVTAYLGGASGVVALSDDVAETVIERYRLRREIVTVIPNAVPSGDFAPATAAERTAARDQFGLGEGDVIGYLGALVPEKGVDLAIRAIAQLPSARLLVVGDGPERTSLESLAAELAPGRVTFAGQIESSRRALHALDTLVLPSRGGDSMPAVLIEAGLCGVPSVATDVGAITDVVVDGVTGRIVAGDDADRLAGALGEILDDDALRQKYGERASARCAANFTIDAVAGVWADVLEAAVRRPNRRSRARRVSRSRG